MCKVKFLWLRIGIFLSGVLVAMLLPRTSRPAATASPARKAVVVELFTSEGCSSCPPADELLGRLRQEKFADGLEIIPLGLHVDYWNFQGWTDRFSSAGYTQRQAKYARKFRIEGPYTPQMVVDGASEFVGSDAARVRSAIVQAALRPQLARVEIAILSLGAPQRLQVQVHAAAGTPGEVLLAYTEDNLATKVGGGENSGRELRHSAVVRELRSLGHLRNGSLEASLPLELKKDWKRNDVRVVVFVQEPDNGAIDGAASLQLDVPAASAR